MSEGPYGNTTRGIVEAFKGNPLALGLVLTNLGLLGFLYYGGVVAHSERQKETELLYRNRELVANLLVRCTPAPPSPDGQKPP